VETRRPLPRTRSVVRLIAFQRRRDDDAATDRAALRTRTGARRSQGQVFRKRARRRRSFAFLARRNPAGGGGHQALHDLPFRPRAGAGRACWLRLRQFAARGRPFARMWRWNAARPQKLGGRLDWKQHQDHGGDDATQRETSGPSLHVIPLFHDSGIALTTNWRSKFRARPRARANNS
jgi:hypothetical protein